MSGGDVEGVLNSGVVEGLCKQSSMIVSSGDGIGSGSGISVLKSLDSLCMGLKSFLRNEEQSKKTTETKKNERKKEESESRFSVVNRSRAALSEIEWTLRSRIVEIGRQEERGGDDERRSEISEKIGGILIRHFPSSFVGLGEKKEGVIRMDIGRLRQEMEENDKRHEMERKKEKEVIKEERRKEREELTRKEAEIARREEERRKEMSEGRNLNDRWPICKRKEMRTNSSSKKAWKGRKRKMKNRNRKEDDKAKWVLPPSNSSLKQTTLTLETSSPNKPMKVVDVSIISSTLAANAQTAPLPSLTGGAGGWDLYPRGRWTWLNRNNTNQKQACAAGAAGQRVVIEADGREGRRTVRMSQDGQTQPTFFTNIPVPFRFAVYIQCPNDSVTIESVEVVKDAQMVGGTIPVQM
ncbi:hypothetical protein BLNAU_10512 [Blattamonas nauphoetae]|uniref:Uncharacterized protein n=1 Tax=Blattamonas nauphoetae TaxID=2049346 RepID=A0ABQ9XSW0_9EUKA|nr:hypothetical protein BLNAU_10512 [Blattamonas nauphoetae]